jgi:hypothetical protein
MHPAALPIDLLLRNCETRRSRRSGPGGQHRNKVETAIVLVHRPTGIKSEASERRSQHENKLMAVYRLRVNLALQLRCERQDGAVPSTLWQSRRRGKQMQVNPHHHDFPALLAEALDVVAAEAYNVASAARQLGVSTSQMVRFLQQEPRAFEQVNRERHQRGLRELR